VFCMHKLDLGLVTMETSNK